MNPSVVVVFILVSFSVSLPPSLRARDILASIHHSLKASRQPIKQTDKTSKVPVFVRIKMPPSPRLSSGAKENTTHAPSQAP